jgi:hypothetical protein
MDRVKQFFVRHKSSLMIVDDLDVVSVAIFPNEANAPLIIKVSGFRFQVWSVIFPSTLVSLRIFYRS